MRESYRKNREHKEVRGSDGYVYHLDCGGFTGVRVSTLVKLHTVNSFSFSCVSHTSEKLFEKE